MAKRLILTMESATHEWQLPVDSDMDAVRENILGAMTRQGVVEVIVHAPGDERVSSPLLVNGAMVAAAAVVETPDSPI